MLESLPDLLFAYLRQSVLELSQGMECTEITPMGRFTYRMVWLGHEKGSEIQNVTYIDDTIHQVHFSLKFLIQEEMKHWLIKNSPVFKMFEKQVSRILLLIEHCEKRYDLHFSYLIK